MPIIYSSVHLRNSRQCVHTLQHLRKHPYVGSYIQKLVVSPRDSAPDPDLESSEGTEEWVAQTLEELAPNFTHMLYFSWDGSCLPKSATFWRTLQQGYGFALPRVFLRSQSRYRCPGLDFIATAISQQDPFAWDDNTDVRITFYKRLPFLIFSFYFYSPLLVSETQGPARTFREDKRLIRQLA